MIAEGFVCVKGENMTGRDLIIYILENKLEDKELFVDNVFSLFITAEEAAIKWNCGTATVKAMINLNRVKGSKIGNDYYVLANESDPFVTTYLRKD